MGEETIYGKLERLKVQNQNQDCNIGEIKDALFRIEGKLDDAKSLHAKHELIDEHRFGKLEVEIEKVKSDVGWTKKIGAAIMASGGGFLHWLHKM